jgi:hypothetical protein
LKTGERNSVSQITGINAQLFQLSTLIVPHLQNELYSNAVSSGLPLPDPSGLLMINGHPIEDYILQMRKKLDMFSSHIKSESVTIDGVTF